MCVPRLRCRQVLASSVPYPLPTADTNNPHHGTPPRARVRCWPLPLLPPLACLAACLPALCAFVLDLLTIPLSVNPLSILPPPPPPPPPPLIVGLPLRRASMASQSS